MADRPNEIFEVAPTRIGGSGGDGPPGRRRRMPIILVLVIALAIPAIAWIGPRIEWRPEVDISFLRPTPTPVPSETPRPRSTPVPSRPLATPLPAISVGVGTHPEEPFAVDAGGLRLVDPTTGSLGPPFGPRGDNDVIFNSSDGDGWWCVCFVRAQESNHEDVSVQLGRFDSSGRQTLDQPVSEYRSTASSTSSDFSARFDLVVSPDERTAYLSSAVRNGEQWSIAVEAIDLATARVAARVDLGSVAIPPVPTPTPPPDQGTVENYFAGPFMRMPPDGGRILVWAWVETYSPIEPQVPPTAQGWLLDLDQDPASGVIGELMPIEPALASRLTSCYGAAWTTDVELAAVCWSTDQTSFETTVGLRLFDVAGTHLGSVDLGDPRGWWAEPLLDRANRSIFLWQPNLHILSRVDIDRRAIDELTVDYTAGFDVPTGAGSGAGGFGVRPDWATFSSDARFGYAPQLIFEPDGNRIYALGILPDESGVRYPASTGVWVFDSSALSLIDRWSALAAYSSIGLSNDGRWLLAAGSPGSDAEGNETTWQSSITVHDVLDGRPALQLGNLGTDNQVFQLPP